MSCKLSHGVEGVCGTKNVQEKTQVTKNKIRLEQKIKPIPSKNKNKTKNNQYIKNQRTQHWYQVSQTEQEGETLAFIDKGGVNTGVADQAD